MKTAPLILIAAALLIGAPAAAADYHAPRNALGQPDLQGVWNTHFVLPMEAQPGVPLTLSEAEAAAYARKLATDAGKLAIFAQDPEVAEIRSDPSRSDLAIVRGQRRTRQVVLPADGMLPLTPGARGQMRFIELAIRPPRPSRPSPRTARKSGPTGNGASWAGASRRSSAPATSIPARSCRRATRW